jgi:hypothetical protein
MGENRHNREEYFLYLTEAANRLHRTMHPYLSHDITPRQKEELMREVNFLLICNLDFLCDKPPEDIVTEDDLFTFRRIDPDFEDFVYKNPEPRNDEWEGRQIARFIFLLKWITHGFDKIRKRYKYFELMCERLGIVPKDPTVPEPPWQPDPEVLEDMRRQEAERQARIKELREEGFPFDDEQETQRAPWMYPGDEDDEPPRLP